VKTPDVVLNFKVSITLFWLFLMSIAAVAFWMASPLFQFAVKASVQLLPTEV
jgi:hypothetical protein